MDIRNASGEPTGRRVPREHELQDGEFMLAVHVFLYREDGQFLLQKRSMQKRLYPGKWDVTGGGVLAGEDSLHAACREVQEEIGLSLAPERMQRLTRLKRPPCFFDVWVCRHTFELQDLVLQREEVDDVRLVTPREMLEILFDREFPDPGYREIITAFLERPQNTSCFQC